ncbi:MAG: TonB-dependent receptor [Gammaproteobacteria bacterium]|nr:TonB-dependent receptor [Gammaproteobacteria bacterium]MYF38848.1 TonB-dependent receptor [Gammaproteobacteria bacterium]
MSTSTIAYRMCARASLASFSAVLIVSVVFGNDAPDDDQLKVEEIVVEGDPRDVPTRSEVGSLTTIDSHALDLVRPRHPHDVFARTPGIWIVKNSGQEHLTGLRSAVLAGSGACGSYLLLEDNIPIRPVGLCNVNGLFELNIEQADRVTILRGPASAIYGGNALRGVINVRPFVSGDTDRAVSLETGVNDYRQIRVAWQHQRVQAKFHATATNGFRDETGFEQQKLNVGWTSNIGTWEANHAVSMTSLKQETGGYVIGYRSFQDSRLRSTNPNPEAFRDAVSFRIYSQFSNGEDLYMYPFVRVSRMNFLQHFLPGQPHEDNQQFSAGAIFFRMFAVYTLKLNIGAHLEWMNASLVQRQWEPTMGSNFLRATRPIGTHYDFVVTGPTLAIFQSTSGTWRDRHEIEQSVRVERTHYQYDNRHLDGNTRDDGSICAFGGCLYTRPSDRTDTFTNIAARVGYKTRITSRSNFWIVSSIGYRPPQISELYRLQSGQMVADLESEETRSLEFGWRTSGHRVDLSIAAYFNSSSSLIFRDAAGMNVSDGATNSQGVEIEFHWRVNENHEISVANSIANHEYDFTRSLTRGEMIMAGNQVDTAPRVLANARWLMTFGSIGKVELEVNRIGSHYLDAANSARYGGHNVVNFRTEFRLQTQWFLFGRILNVFDNYYADRADFAFGNYRYFPADLRQFFVGIKRRF